MGLLPVAAAVAAAALLPRWIGAGGRPATTVAARTAAPSRVARRASGRTPAHPAPRHLVERELGTLPAPLQGAAAAPAGAPGVALLGGLTAADTSTSRLLIAVGGGAHRLADLPTALHDAAAVRLGHSVYLFGGGDGVRQLDAIVRVDPEDGRATVVGRLPAPSSDQAAAAIGGTAYVVGGYAGSRWLDTIVARRPGSQARVVGHTGVLR